MIIKSVQSPLSIFLSKKTLVTVLFFTFFTNILISQNYIGIGAHTAPPAQIENCCNSYIRASPTLMPAWSISYKRQKENKKGNEWYYEAGITTQGLNFTYQHYLNNLESAWVKFNMSHVGFLSVFFGSGYAFKILEKSTKQKFILGLEGSIRRSHDLGGLRARNFGVTYASEDITLPLFLRLQLGYSYNFSLFKKIPVHLLIYTKLSFQDVAVSPQYIRDPSTDEIDDTGKYHLNNSEAGLKLYTDIGKKYYHFNWEKREKKPKINQTGPSNFRISFDGQMYAPPATKYYIPQVDSFSLKGVGFTTTNQYGLSVEFVHAKNKDWATSIGIGFGQISDNYQFEAISEFTMDGFSFNTSNHSGTFNSYLISSVGLAYKHPSDKGVNLQHTINATLVVPLEKEDSGFFQFERSFLGTPPHLIPTFILKGNVNYDYGRDKVLAGVEYRPELLFNLDKRIFYGIGLVLNYSYGIVGQGRVAVDNGRTQYFGGYTQGFSKIGISARIGWRSSKF